MTGESLATLSQGLFAASDEECLATFAGVAVAAVRENAIDQQSQQKVIDDLYALAVSRGLPEMFGEDAVQFEIATAINGVKANGHGAHVSRYGGMRFEQIGVAGMTGAYEWFVEDIVPLGEAVLIFGDSGTGKSFNSFDMAMAAARGLQWNGFNVEPGLVVYVAAEAGKGFGKRKLAYMIHHKLEMASALPFYLFTKRPDFFNSDDDVLGLIAEIKMALPSYAVPLRAIYLDTLSALSPGMNENASADVSRVRQRIEMIREAFNYRVAVVVVHHKPKGGQTPRGHGSLTNDFETTIEYETIGRNSIGQPLHRATVRKQREGKSGLNWEFALPVVTVGTNKWGRPETSCVVAPYSANTRSRGGYNATPNQVLFMGALFDALDAEGVAPADKEISRSIHRVVDLQYVRDRMKARMVDADSDAEAANNRFRKAFKDAGDKLRNVKVIGVKVPWVWPTGKPVHGMSTDLELLPLETQRNG